MRKKEMVREQSANMRDAKRRLADLETKEYATGAGSLTQEQVEDIVGGMVTGNTETGLAVTYDDVGAKLNFDAQTAGDARYAPIAKGVTNGDSHDHGISGGGQIDHDMLAGLEDDDHTQYALLAGRASGQTVYGGNAANEDLILHGTNHATRTSSYVLIQPTDGNTGIGPVPSAAPASRLHVEETTADVSALFIGMTSADATLPRGMTYSNRDTSANSAHGIRFDFVTDSGATATRGAAIFAGKEQLFTATTSTRDGYLGLMTVLNGTLAEYLRITSGGLVSIGHAAPLARLHVLETTLGAVVERLQSTATNDDVIQDTMQGRVATTNATVTTLATLTLAASTNYLVEAYVVARRTGGTAGTAEDGAAYILRGLFQGASGTAALVGSVGQTVIAESQAGWDATLDTTGATVRVRVTGAADNTITWHCTLRYSPVGT